MTKRAPTFPTRMPKASIHAGCSSIAGEAGVIAGASAKGYHLDELTPSVNPARSRAARQPIETKGGANHGAGAMDSPRRGGEIGRRGAEEICPPNISPPPISALTNSVTRAAVLIPLRTERGQNTREHWARRAARVKAEKWAVAWSLFDAFGHTPPWPLPIAVTLTRCAPSGGLDDDNLVGSLKAIRDAVAEWLGVDDKHSQTVRYAYAQQHAREWAVRITFQPLTTTTQETQP